MFAERNVFAVKGLFASGHIQSFSDVFHFVPRTPLAKYCRIPVSRFRDLHLMPLPDIFTCSKILAIPASTIFQWCHESKKQEPIKVHSISDNDALKMDIIRDRIALGKLQQFSDIFAIIPRSTVAGLLVLNNDRMADLIFHPEIINVKMINRFAHLFQIAPAIIFHLVQNEWFANQHLPIQPIKTHHQTHPTKIDGLTFTC